MKIYYKSKVFILVFLSVLMLNCSHEKTDFGFTGAIKGTIKDDAGTALYGDINSNNLVVKLLGVGDKQAIDTRVKGDGTYQNMKMFPKLHKVWLEGPIVKSDTLSVDFSSGVEQVKDFTVTPLITPKVIKGTVSGTSIIVDYSIVATTGYSVKSKEIYCSTVPYPTAAIGSSTNNYFTKKVTLPAALSGNVTISDPLIVSGTKYYIRIGALANVGVLLNYSNQIEVTIP
ncbi:MAG TPA: hypothetical protein DEH15_19215 [Marinilabiliales bacterium]|nr:hypothetical protein [Marinilabiliales bacterium]